MGYVLPVAGQVERFDQPDQLEYGLFDDQGSGIRGLPVRSHTSKLFRSDETIQLGGSFSIRADTAGQPIVSNKSRLNVRDAIWMDRSGGQPVYYLIGAIGAGEEVARDKAEVIDRAQLSTLLRSRLEQHFNETDSDADGRERLIDDDGKIALLSQAMTNLFPANSMVTDCRAFARRLD